MSSNSPPTQELLEQFQGLRRSIGKYEKDIKSLRTVAELEAFHKSLATIGEEVDKTSELLLSLICEIYNQKRELKIKELPLKVGDMVGFEEISNRGSRYEYRVYRVGKLVGIKVRFVDTFSASLGKDDEEAQVTYEIRLSGQKSTRVIPVFGRNARVVLSMQDLEAEKKVYEEALAKLSKAAGRPKKYKPLKKKEE